MLRSSCGRKETTKRWNTPATRDLEHGQILEVKMVLVLIKDRVFATKLSSWCVDLHCLPTVWMNLICLHLRLYTRVLCLLPSMVLKFFQEPIVAMAF